MQNTVKTSTTFIQNHKDSISQTISQSVAMQGIQNFSCNSTSLCPSKEPAPVSTLLTVFQDLYKNITDTLETALAVGEDFELLDKKIGDSSDKLNFTLTSTKAPNVPLLQYDDQKFDFITTDELVDQAEKMAQEKNIDTPNLFGDETTVKEDKNPNSNNDTTENYDGATVAAVAAGGALAGIASPSPIGSAPSPGPSTPSPSTPGTNPGTATPSTPTQSTETEDKDKDKDKDKEQEKEPEKNQDKEQEKEEDNLDKLPTLEEKIEQKEEIKQEIEKNESEIQEEKPQSSSQTSQGGIYNPTNKPKIEKPNTNVRNENESEIIGPQKPIDTNITPNDQTSEITEPDKPIDADITSNDETSEVLPPIIEIEEESNPQNTSQNVNTSNESTSNIGATLGVASLVGAAVGGAAYALHKKKESDYSYNEEYDENNNENDNILEGEGGE